MMNADLMDNHRPTKYNRSNKQREGIMIIVRTETWNTKTGKIVKAVVRDEKGKLVGVTNQTQPVKVPDIIVGK